MNIIKIDNHVEQAKDRLLSQFRYSENINKLLEIWVNRIQNYENLLFDILEKTNLNNATGKILDLIGKNINLPRPVDGEASINDNAYKALIYAEIAKNTSNGTNADIENLLRILGATKIYLVDIPQASIQININGVLLLSIEQIKKAIKKATASIEIELSSFTSLPFGFEGDNTGYGFGVGEIGSSV